jgi:hypothetical protein
MSWRPKEGWVNPFQGAFERCQKSYPNGIPRGYHILQEVGHEEGHEEGADKMLKALVEWLKQYYKSTYPLLDRHNNVGLVVEFVIPEKDLKELEAK